MPPVTIDESDEQDVVVRPRLVTIGIVLWVLDVVAFLGSAALTMGGHNAFVDYLYDESAHRYTRDLVNAQLTFEEFAALGVGVLAAVFVYLLMKGNRWSRILLVGVGFLQLVCLLAFSYVILPIPAGTVLGLVGLAFLYLPRSNAYYAGLRRLA